MTLMVGDNLRQDIEGAVAVGMRAVLVCRRACPARDVVEVPGPDSTVSVPVITTLAALPGMLG